MPYCQHKVSKTKERERGRERHRQTDRQTGRQTDRAVGRERVTAFEGGYCSTSCLPLQVEQVFANGHIQYTQCYPERERERGHDSQLTKHDGNVDKGLPDNENWSPKIAA